MKLVRSEDLEARIRELLSEAEAVGRDAQQAALDAGEEVRTLPQKPDLEQAWIDDVRAALERELTIARPIEGEAVIEKSEQDREIAKRALAHLRIAQLRDIAANHGLLKDGNLDDLADRIVRAFKGDQEEIARLVVAYETEPPPERRFTTRVFRVAEGASDLSHLSDRVQLFAGRYIRTGIARWFIIQSVESAGDRLSLSGTFRFFRADAAQDDEEFQLVSEPGTAMVRLSMRVDQPYAEVEARGTTESRAAMGAFERASGLDWRDSLPISTRAPAGELSGWDARSVFMVDLLSSRFRSDSVEVLNLTTAGFQTDRAGGDEESSRPAVKSVRLQGRHLLDSRPACELLVRGQALIELGMIVRYRTDAQNDFLLPLTIRLERDHATVMTGFGLHGPEIAHLLHQTVSAGLRTAFEHGLADEAALRRLAKEVHDRATEEGPVDRATIFVPPDDPDSEHDDG